MSLCNTCKSAGKQNQAGNFEEAAKLHEQCEYEGCYCQHETGSDWINQGRLVFGYGGI